MSSIFKDFFPLLDVLDWTIAMSKATDWIKDIGPQHLSLALNCPDYKLGLNSDLGILIAGA